MRGKAIEVGQRYRKADGTGIVFEVVDLVTSQNLPHARIVRVDNPTEERVIAISALLDRRHFVATASTPAPGGPALGGRKNAASIQQPAGD